MTAIRLTVPANAPNYPTILHALEDVARRAPNRTALICEDRSVTFADHVGSPGTELEFAL